jgi:eukaryotic-like serine/threonine-protein kinase
VTSTSPQGGAFESKGTQIKLNYSVRPGAKALPDVSGMSVADAERTLAADGWTNVQQSTSLVPSVKVSNGHVVSTNPSVGIKVPPGALVLLNVSGGGKRVPSVDDLSEADAQAALQSAGLVGAVVTTPGPPGAQPGTVWQSKPGVGRVVLPGSTITIYVVPQAASPTPTVSATPSPTASASPTPNASP